MKQAIRLRFLHLPTTIRSATIHGMCQPNPRPELNPPFNTATPNQLQVPQFGILHLLLWTAASAGLLGVFELLTADKLQQLPPKLYWLTRSVQTLTFIAYASAFVGSFVLVQARFYKRLRALQPGHWLVLIAALELAIELVAALLALSSGPGRTTWITMIAALVLPAAIQVFAFYQLQDTKRWKVFFAAYALAAITRVAARMFPVVFMSFDMPLVLLDWWWLLYLPNIICNIATVLAFITAIVLDIRHHTPRDWLHWLGIVVSIAICTLTLAARLIPSLLH